MTPDRTGPKQTLLRECHGGDVCDPIAGSCVCGPRVEVSGTRVVEKAPKECQDCRLHRIFHHEDVRDLREIAVIDSDLLALLEVFDPWARAQRYQRRLLVRRRLDVEPFVDEDGRFGDLC